MRFKIKKKPKLGDVKIKVKYLFLPKSIGTECRWLEFAKIKYTYKSEMVSYDMGGVAERRWGAIACLPYDPVYDCKTFKEEGCAHVDGYLCDMEDCNMFKPH